MYGRCTPPSSTASLERRVEELGKRTAVGNGVGSLILGKIGFLSSFAGVDDGVADWQTCETRFAE